MTEFVSHIVARLPQTWLGRAVWLMLAISAFWVAYTFGLSYGECRAHGWKEVPCVLMAAYATWLAVLLQVIGTVATLLSSILP